MRAALIFLLALGELALCDEPAPQYRYRNQSISGATSEEPVLAEFSAQQLRNYLEKGADLWSKQKECFSCHTHGIYAAIRPALTPFWGPPAEELRQFLVSQAGDEDAYGDDEGSAPVRIAYLARALANWDAELADSTSPETVAALRQALDFQDETGAIRAKDRWPPLNSTTWHGSIMTAMAIADAPGWLEDLEDEQLLAKIELLKQFLRESEPKNDHERTLLLWASSRMPDLLTGERREAILTMIRDQQRGDGSWSIRTFAMLETWGGGKRAQELAEEPDFANPPGDGYQTGLAIVVLRDCGVPADDPQIQRGIDWLLSNQRKSGRWWTKSLNTRSRFHYISYSGSAYAALALAKCGKL